MVGGLYPCGEFIGFEVFKVGLRRKLAEHVLKLGGDEEVPLAYAIRLSGVILASTE